MAAATESASVGGSVCTSVIIPPVTQCDHTLPPSPALTLTNTPIPTPTPALTIDAESLQDVLTETQLSENTDTNTAGQESRAAMVDGSNYSIDMRTEVSTYDNPNSIELMSVDPPCVVLGDCWQITDAHSLGCQEQTEWGRNAGHSVSNTTDVCEQKEQVADEKNPSSCVTAGAQLQQPQPPSGEGGPHLDTGQGEMSATPSVSEAQKLLIRSSHQPWPFLSLKTSTPCTSSSLNTNFAGLFQTSVEPNLKSGHIDHNLKPLQITSNFEDKRNPSRAAFRFSDSFGVVRFQNGSQQTNQTSFQTTPNAPLQTKSHFDGKQTSVSSLNTNYFFNDINNSDTLFFDFESKQHSIKDNHPAVSTSFDGSLRNMQSHSAHTSNTCQDFDNTSLENNSYSQPSLSVEQYLFDLKDLPEFANIPTEDDVGGDMFELTPTIPPNALPSCSWQPQQTWYNYTATSTTKPETMAITAQSLMGTATSCSSGSYSQVTSVQYHASPHTVDHTPTSFSQGSSSSKMAVNGIPATVNATGPDTCPSKTVDQTPMMIWTQSMDPDSQPSLGLPHRLDPVQEALVSALGADMHMSLLEMHSRSNNCQDSNLYPTNPIVHAATGTVNSTGGCMHKGVNDEMGYTSALLSPPVTPCPEKESGYATTDDQEATPASFSCTQYDGGDLDGSYTTYARQAYVGSENGGMGGGGHFQGHYPSHDSHHYSVNHAGVTDVSKNNNSVYYPFNDLMQLNPSLPGDQEPSVHNIHHPYPHSDPHGYPSHSYTQSLPPSQQVTPKTGRKRCQGRGRGRSQDVIARVQIQSDQITSSLLGQQQMQAGVVAKRTYKRRNSSVENLPRRKSTSKAKPGVGALEAETDGKKSRHNEPLNQKAVVIMNEWYSQNEENPYPTNEEKELMAADGGITTMQVKSWFANKRNRSNNTRPKVQKRAMEEKLMQICRKAAGHATDGDNSFIIKELSQIIHTFDKDVGSSMVSPDPGDEDDD